MAAVLEALTEEESYLLSILTDQSGLDQAEFLWYAADHYEGCFRAWPFQRTWWRNTETLQIDQCIPEGSLVLTNRGHVPIEDVKVGDEVWTGLGRWQPVTYKWDKGEQPVVKVRGYGHHEFVATADHKVFTANGTIEAGALEGERWLSPLVDDISGGLPELDRVYASGAANLPEIDERYFPWICGLFVAEGSLSSTYGKGGKRNRITWSVHVEEVPEVIEALSALNLNYNVDSPSKNCRNVRVICEPLATMFSEFGRGAHNKRVPGWVFKLPTEQKRLFVSGMLDGDGHYRNGGCEYVTVSKSLAFDLKVLANAVGMSAAVRVARQAGTTVIEGRIVNTKKTYVTSVKYLDVQKSARIKKANVGYSALVSSVVSLDKKMRCYDLEVGEDHSFCVEGIVVSNCSRSSGKSLSVQVKACAFPLLHPAHEMLITAPEGNHLEAVTDLVETRLRSNRFYSELLLNTNNQGIKHRPFLAKFRNGARIMGRIPQRDGRGVKGVHPLWLEMDEAQDYPSAGWTEVIETLKQGHADAKWRCVAEDQMVLTRRGWVKIQGVLVGDEVWTHKNRWRKVLNNFDNGLQECVKVDGSGHRGLIVTPNHKMWLRSAHRVNDKKILLGPEWKSISAASGGHEHWASPSNVTFDTGGVPEFEPRTTIFEAGHAWSPVRSLTECGIRHVYDLEVEDDHSYVVEGMVVSNCHGVTKGIRDEFWKFTQPGSDWFVHRYAAMWRPTWTDQERQEKINMYGSANHPDYRRNVLGKHGDVANPLFVLTRLIRCFDLDPSSSYNDLYTRLDINAEMIEDQGNNILNAIGEIPMTHKKFKTTWAGMDVGFCVDDKTEIFTQRGWIDVDNLKIGDKSLGINPETGKSEWQSVFDIYKESFESIQMIEMKGQSFDALTTPHHKWLVKHDPSGKLRWKQTRDLNTKDAIPMTAPRSDIPSVAEWSDEFVELVAWFWTEGWWTSGTSAGIAQSETANPECVHRIRCLMASVFGEPGPAYVEGTRVVSHFWTEDKGGNGYRGFRFRGPVVEILRNVVSEQKVPTPEFLQSLTESQLNLFIETSIDADGWRTDDGALKIEQKLEEGIKSFEYACALAGMATSTSYSDDRKRFHLSIMKASDVRPIKSALFPRKTGQAMTVTPVLFSGMIWCPTVTHGNWLARRNGSVYFTGNTNHPSEILVFEEDGKNKAGDSVLRLLSRFHLERISNPDQVKLILWIMNFYRLNGYSLDKTGVGLPLFQDIQHEAENMGMKGSEVLDRIKGYNFSSKILVDFDQSIHVEEFDGDPVEDTGIKRNVLEYACVDKATESFTKRGWVGYEELTEGDLILTLNPETYMAEWKPVLKMNVYDGIHSVREFEGRSFSSVSTLNHKWITTRQRDGEVEWRTTADLVNGSRIPILRSGGGADVAIYDDAFVRAVAWVYTEGWWGHGRTPNSCGVGIYQSSKNDDCVKQIDSDLSWFQKVTKTKSKDGYLWWVSADGGRLLEGAISYPDKMVSDEFITSLTEDQAKEFVRISMMADNDGARAFSQSKRGHAETFFNACVIAGMPVRMSHSAAKWTVQILERTDICPMAAVRNSGLANVVEREHSGIVWCPTTANGTWLARREGRICFTGNSDVLRDYVDNGRVIMPDDRDLLAEFQGQTWTTDKSGMDQYGRKKFSAGKFHALDAARMAVLGQKQYGIEAFMREHAKNEQAEEIFDTFFPS